MAFFLFGGTSIFVSKGQEDTMSHLNWLKY
jgi:hypothetical protein